jgi:hypothetical protein
MPMSSSPEATPAETAQDRAAGCACRDGEAARRQRVLDELAEIGMDLARTTRRQAMDAAAPQPAGDVALAFSRIARAVRQTVALEARLDEDRHTRDRDTRHRIEAEQERRRAVAQIRVAVRKDDIRDAVEQAIETEARERGREVDVERLLADLDERLEDAEDDADFTGRPIGELIARICQDLGVTADPSLCWDDEDWVAPEAGAVQPRLCENSAILRPLNGNRLRPPP